MKRFAIVATLAVLSGCASLSKMPDWINGQPAAYPAASYLIGRGEAGNADQAQDRARADLAKIFAVTVSIETEDVQSFRREAQGERNEASVRRKIDTRTERLVSGMRIAEVWQDPKTKNVHALAVLPRQQAATALRQEIAGLDQGVERNLAQSRETGEALTQIAAASRALDLQRAREELQKTLRVVDPTGHGAESRLSAARLEADLAELLKRMKLAVRVEGSAPAGFDTVMRGAVGHAGFLIDSGETPAHVLEAKIEVEDLGKREGWHWLRATVEVTLKDGGSGRVRGSQRWPLKAAGQEPATATARLLAEADGVLKKELRATLVGFAGR